MTARFVPPTPNCGHVDGVTFTHDVDRNVWLCTLCLTSLGFAAGVYPKCTTCGGRLPNSALLSSSASRLCSHCARDRRAHHLSTRTA